MRHFLPGTGSYGQVIGKTVLAIAFEAGNLILLLEENQQLEIQSYWEYFFASGAILETQFAGMKPDLPSIQTFKEKTIDAFELRTRKINLRFQDSSWIEVRNEQTIDSDLDLLTGSQTLLDSGKRSPL